MGTVLPGVVPVKVGVKVAGRYSTSVRIVVSRCGVVVQWIAVRNSSVMRTDVSSIRPIITTNIDTLSFASSPLCHRLSNTIEHCQTYL